MELELKNKSLEDLVKDMIQLKDIIQDIKLLSEKQQNDINTLETSIENVKDNIFYSENILNYENEKGVTGFYNTRLIGMVIASIGYISLGNPVLLLGGILLGASLVYP